MKTPHTLLEVMPGTKRTVKRPSNVGSSSDGELVDSNRKSCDMMLRKKTKPDFKKLSGHKVKDTRPLDVISEHEGERDQSRSRSSGQSQSDSNSEVAPDTETTVRGSVSGSENQTETEASEDDGEDKLKQSEQHTEKLKAIEQQTRERIESYSKLLHDEKKMKKKQQRRKSNLQKLQEVEEENNKRSQLIADLQRQEDELADKIQATRTKKKQPKSLTPSAHSTPRTSGEYNNLIQNILNLSFDEDELLLTGDGH